jgi:hypothetical protein
MVEQMPSVALQQMIDASNPAGIRNYITADYLAGLPRRGDRGHVPLPPDEARTAHGDRDASWRRRPLSRAGPGDRFWPRAPGSLQLHHHSKWDDPADDEANLTWTRKLAAAMRPFTTGRP